MGKGFSGFPNNMGNMQGLMRQAQKMKEDLEKAQKDSENIKAEGSAGGGVVKVSCNGKFQLETVSLDASVVNPSDIEMLQDLIMAASNEALKSVQEKIKESMSKVTGGVNIPGLF